MTPAEIKAYNDGVRAVLAIAKRSAESIRATSKRRVYEDFAVAVLTELADAEQALVLPASAEIPRESQ